MELVGAVVNIFWNMIFFTTNLTILFTDVWYICVNRKIVLVLLAEMGKIINFSGKYRKKALKLNSFKNHFPLMVEGGILKDIHPRVINI